LFKKFEKPVELDPNLCLPISPEFQKQVEATFNSYCEEVDIFVDSIERQVEIAKRRKVDLTFPFHRTLLTYSTKEAFILA
jgi:hypothetical protein